MRAVGTRPRGWVVKAMLLQVELELKSERENAEVRINSVEDYQKIVDAEWDIIYDKLDKIANSGATIGEKKRDSGCSCKPPR